jgi:hypothetical protein
MLKLTRDQIDTACRLADRIIGLEESKDRTRNVQCRVGSLLIDVPPELVRAEIAKELDESHAALRDLGIELLPAPESEGGINIVMGRHLG